MKLLHQIVLEELQKFYGASNPKVENGVATIDLRAIHADIFRRRDVFMKRLQEDKALTELCFVAVNQIVAATQAPMMNVPQRQDAYTQAVVEAIIIWERANELFNEQLGRPPELPAPTNG